MNTLLLAAVYNLPATVRVVTESLSKLSETQSIAAPEDFLREHDVLFRLAVIKEFLESEDMQSHAKADRGLVKQCLKGLKEAAEKVSEVKSEIDLMVKEHQLLYFSEWRTLDVSEAMGRLKKQYQLLESRFEIMCKVIKISGEARPV